MGEGWRGTTEGDEDTSTEGSLPLHLTAVHEVERVSHVHCTFQMFQVVDFVLHVCRQLISLLCHLTQLALHLHAIQRREYQSHSFRPSYMTHTSTENMEGSVC